MSKTHIDRYDEDYSVSELGRIFFNPNCDYHENLSGINILYNSIDTVRQLYKLHLNPEFIDYLDGIMEEEGFHTRVCTVSGQQFALKRGGASGYKYILQNNDYGLIMLVKHQKAKADSSGTHLKIEVSPKLISELSFDTLQAMMDDIANAISLNGDYQASGDALHLALDFQGWEPPVGFEGQLTCRSRRVTNRNGIDEIVLDGGLSAVHGRGQSYLFGSANGIQLALYNKSLEAHASDKLDYFQECWSRKTEGFDTPLYDPDKPVWRLELRLHHSVIKQFSDMNVTAPINCVDEKEKPVSYGPMKVSRLTTYESLIPHLGGLWNYGLNNFRYDLNTKYIHPVWTIFMTESGFDEFQQGFIYRRQYKTAGVGNEKNVAIALGNMLSIFARNKISVPKAYEFIKNSGIYGDILSYFRHRGLSKADLYRFIEDGMIRRLFTSKVAA